TTSAAAPPTPADPGTPTAGANPYSFYGSVAECAFAQRARCESCLPANNCVPVTNADGASECTQLAADNGRGYFLICADLAVAITAVDGCIAIDAPGCARDPHATGTLDKLAANAD